MAGNIIGRMFKVLSFGESHGKCIGVVIDGCPAGLELSEEDIQKELDLRRPGTSRITTSRMEEDRVEILSGVFNGYTTGAPICMIIWNKDIRSEDYESIRFTPRPSHADYFAYVKYGGYNDYRGGGRFSGRITAGFVMAGAVAKKLLKKILNVEVIAYALEIGGEKAEDFTLDDARRYRYENDVRAPTPEAAVKMKEKIQQAIFRGDTVGGVIECIVTGLPIGLGEPVFDALDSDLAKAIFSIPAVKGIEFGAGFKAARMFGSEHNDPFIVEGEKIKLEKNDAGGVVGGISTGAPLHFRVVVKPPSSIGLKQKTIDLKTGKQTEIIVGGRHDPCIVPRAVPVVEAMTAIVLADHGIRYGVIPPVIRNL